MNSQYTVAPNSELAAEKVMSIVSENNIRSTGWQNNDHYPTRKIMRIEVPESETGILEAIKETGCTVGTYTGGLL